MQKLELLDHDIYIYICECLEFMQSDEFKKLTEGKKLCIVTDPPFNIGYHYNEYKDKMTENSYYEMLKKVFTMYEIPYVVIHYAESLYKIASYTGNIPEKVVSWVYNSNTGKQHRDIAFFKVKPDFRKVLQPYKNPNDKRIQERISRGITGGRLYDWWNINQVKNVSKNKINHPCVMPLEVMKNIIGILPDDYVIFDPFCGAGTTALACKLLGRSCICCDINEDYCNITYDRLITTLC